MKHKRPAYLNDLPYVSAWMTAAAAATAARPWVEPPPADLLHRYGRPQCPTCWDTGLCAECLGRYPQYCPADCADGTCACAAGQARRAAYRHSLQESGLA